MKRGPRDAFLGGRAAAVAWKDHSLAYLRREDTWTYCVAFTVTGVRPDAASEPPAGG